MKLFRLKLRILTLKTNTITINGVEKNSLPRSVKVSSELIAMIKLYGSQPRVFIGNCETYARATYITFCYVYTQMFY